MPVRRDDTQLIHGSRDTYNPSAISYRQAAARITRKLAQRYADHPALYMWHLHNEYGTTSVGPVSDAAFRVWLREQYGTLDALNEAWHTRFWSQLYTQWSQITCPRSTQYLDNPGHLLAYKRFAADELLACLREQMEIVKEITPHIPATTNFILPTWNNYDVWDFSEAVNIVSVDHYLDSVTLDGEAHAAFGADLARSLNQGDPWLLMEQATTVISDHNRGITHSREPGRLLRNTLQYLSRGSSSSLFFQWRTGVGGSEFFHTGMVPHTGEDSRTYREISELGAVLKDLAPIAALPGNDQRTVSPQIAIVWESDAWWATETRGLPSSLLEFFPSLREVHKALWYQGFTTDFAQLGGDLSQYDLVLIPSCIPVSDEQAANLESYVRAGGHAAAWFFTGSTDQYLRVRAGRTFNAAVAPTLGVRVEEHWPLAPEEPVALSNGMSGALWSETIHLEGAESLVEYREGPLDGLPAITRHRLGEGTATYISTSIEGEELQTFLASLATEAGIAKDHPDSGNGLEIVTRSAGTERYAFVLNHSSRARTVTISGTDTISGQKLGPTLNMAPKTWRVITL